MNISENPVLGCKIIAHTKFGDSEFISMRLTYARMILNQVSKHRLLATTTRSNRYTDYNLDTDILYKHKDIPKDIFEKHVNHLSNMITLLKKNEVHREDYNRFLEHVTYCSQIMTIDVKDFRHFYELRTSEHAQYEIRELATSMRNSLDQSTPLKSKWHVPYTREDTDINLKNIISAIAKVARVSRNNDLSKTNFDKDIKTFDFLLDNKHFSVFEHIRYKGENFRFLVEKEIDPYSRNNESAYQSKVYGSHFERKLKSLL